MTTDKESVAALVASVKPLLPELLTPKVDSSATLVIILDGILASIALMSKVSTEEEPVKDAKPKSKNREIHIEDIEAWHKGGREQYWPRTSLSQFTTIVRKEEQL